MPLLCRDCFYWSDNAPQPAGSEARESLRQSSSQSQPPQSLSSGPTTPKRCPQCQSPRVISHPELGELGVAHIDCDAFFASVEKRDRPELKDKPVIVGGGKRGVVSTACYVARLYGVKSAMPIFKAKQACPNAVIIPPESAKYREAGYKIRGMMQELTPLVEPLSIDEAFLDLRGTEKLHGHCAAICLAKLCKEIERQVGVTASIGLSYNKSLAKLASDLDKPRGFAVIGRAEARDFLADKPIRMIWGVGKSLESSLLQDGIRKIRDLLPYSEEELIRRYGLIGKRLYHFPRGEDDRPITPDSPTKSISAETTFEEDIADYAALSDTLWPLCEKVSRRLKRSELAARTITLKLKTSGFRQITRSRKAFAPTQLAEELYRTAQPLLQHECQGQYFRLIGIGASDLVPAEYADPPDLADEGKEKRKKVELALDAVRDKLGEGSIVKGRTFRAPTAGDDKEEG